MKYLSYLHGDYRARNKFPMVTNSKMPGSYSHQIVKVELNNESTFSVNLQNKDIQLRVEKEQSAINLSRARHTILKKYSLIKTASYDS